MRNEPSITSLASLQFFINHNGTYHVILANTNFDMDSDENYHSQSDFYHLEEMENNGVKENIVQVLRQAFR